MSGVFSAWLGVLLLLGGIGQAVDEGGSWRAAVHVTALVWPSLIVGCEEVFENGRVYSITYEADGQTRHIDHANGVWTTFEYSPTRPWLTRVVTTRPGGAVILDTS